MTTPCGGIHPGCGAACSKEAGHGDKHVCSRCAELTAYLLKIARDVGVPEDREVEVLAEVFEMVVNLGADVPDAAVQEALRVLVMEDACGTDKDFSDALVRLRALLADR